MSRIRNGKLTMEGFLREANKAERLQNKGQGGMIYSIFYREQ